jgi:hypothetical protein
MVRLIVLFLLADIALLVLALVDCLTTPGGQMRALSKPLWVLLILLFSPIGSISWFIAGRPREPHPAGVLTRANRRPHVVAPDDDPEFLRDLSRSLDEERRDEERRRRETGGDDAPTG